MPVPFIMPKFDMDQEKATIVTWLKKEGERVKAEESVLVVETEKVAIDVPAPASGILAGICAQEGDVVPVTQVIAYILKEGESLPARTGQPALSAGQAVPQAPVTPSSLEGAHPQEGRNLPATPVAARMAQAEGVDLSQVVASGERITRADVERHLAGKEQPAVRVTIPATPAARRLAREKDVDLGKLSGSGPRGRIQAADILAAPAAPAALLAQTAVAGSTLTQAVGQAAPLAEPAAPDSARRAKVSPLAGMRKKIAERMQASFQTSPHISLMVEVDVTRLEELRGRLNGIAGQHNEPRISLTALLVRMCAWALQRHPAINSSIIDNQVHCWEESNIGVATALAEGLIVPVIHAAEGKSISAIAAELQDLTARAREGRLALADVQHGTFTISNLGMFGIQQFRAIINPPESAIIAVGSVVRKPVVINEQDEVAVRPMMTLTLAADHRLVDGVAAARFLSDLVRVIQNPELLMY